MGIRIHVANPSEKQWARHRYLFTFGAYGAPRVLAYGDNVDDALEAAAELLVERGWLGFITPHDAPEIQEWIQDAIDELGPCADESEVWEHATRDQTHTEAGYICSWEWHMIEDPTNEALRAIAA